MPDDVDFALYTGGFLSAADKDLLAGLPLMDPEALGQVAPVFDDPRYGELLFRYRARNFHTRLLRWNGDAGKTYEGIN